MSDDSDDVDSEAFAHPHEPSGRQAMRKTLKPLMPEPWTHPALEDTKDRDYGSVVSCHSHCLQEVVRSTLLQGASFRHQGVLTQVGQDPRKPDFK